MATASVAKIAANRANATLSTGPADTSRSRFNGLTHGLTSKQPIVRGEDQNQYDAFSANLLRELAPCTATETVLAERIIAAAWRLKRFTRVESAFFNNRIDAFMDENPEGDPDAAMAALFTEPAEMARMRLFLRYQTSVQREYDAARREFQKAQAERQDETIENTGTAVLSAAPDGNNPNRGFASQPAPNHDVPAFVTAINGQSPRDTLSSK
jgi:hypothetical protein